MTYTKQELINAFCRAREYNAEKDGTKEEFIQQNKVQIQARINKMHARIPTAIQRMTNIAIAKLQEEEKEANIILIE